MSPIYNFAGYQMKYAHFVLVLLLFLPTFPESISAAEIDDSRWLDLAIPADALAVGRLDVKALLRTPFGKSMRRARKPTYDTIDTFLRHAFGLRIRQLDYFWYVFPGSQGITLLQGDFNVKKVSQHMDRMPAWKSLQYDGALHVSSFKNAAGRAQMAALLRPNLVAIGPSTSIQNLLEQWQAGGGGQIREGVAGISASNAHVAAAYLDMGVFQATNPAYSFVQSATMEGTVDEDIHLTLYARSINEQITQGLEQVVLGLVQVLSGRENISRQPAAMAALNNTRVSRSDALLQINTKVEGELVLRGFSGTNRQF